MSPVRYTASTITDDALDELYDNASRGWRRGDAWKQRAQAAEAVIERVRQMTDAWEQRLPDTIRTATAVEAIRAALPEPKESTTP
ncbi:hypothetical protein ACFVAF_34695 [Streptomyces sp. NPDC057596]|uniref:hypothetical protein n=1 Tax=unclassified Streptomyces TaxID=2593676 RepID=UPI00342215B0